MLRVIIIKPSKYDANGYVERFRRGFMPNSTVPYIRSMTPSRVDNVDVEILAFDEYVHTDLEYLESLRDPSKPTLLAMVGVQSHQFQRALDLSAFAVAHGVRHCVIGGPHAMTCDTTMLQNRGVSFALAEAEMVWRQILKDAVRGELQPVYGEDRRWSQQLDAPVVIPPSKADFGRYVVPMLGIYPARGCPFTCNFCSVIKIAGRKIRSQPVETTIQSLRNAKAAGVRLVMFTSDNFNKYPDAVELLEQMIQEDLKVPFFVQCDTQIAKQGELVELLGRAGCFEIFVGVESFRRKTLLAAHKAQNHPSMYAEIVRLCRKANVVSHFSNILGFPDDNAQDIREHRDVLNALRPDVASFYILCPIPGTEQYDDFLSAGFITERNLDRFDATSATWRHPVIGPRDLQDLLFSCYREFYSTRHILGTALRSIRFGSWGGMIPYIGHPVFSRYSASRKMHPMSGGIGRVRKDHVQDYLELRRARFGYDQVPLPRSLKLSRFDEELNRGVKPAV